MLNIKKRNIPFSPPDITEEEIDEVKNVMKSGWITTGPLTKKFEREISKYNGVNNSVCLNSATAAMELTLRILGVGPGDEVITSAYTYTATASVVNHIGAKLVLVDTAPDSYEMDYLKLSDLITEKTKVIIPVDLAGKICDYETIYSIVESKKHLFKASSKLQRVFNRIIVMSDAAHAFGATKNGKVCGNISDFTCFSFHAVKNLTTAEGGAVSWKNRSGLDDKWLYKQYMLYSLHGQSKDAFSKNALGAWEYDIIYPGYKCNMTDISSSIGLKQLERYNDTLKRRMEITQIYDSALNPLGVKTIEHKNNNENSSCHLYITRVPGINESERNDIIKEMAEFGITCNVHYKPLPMMTAYKNMGFNIENYPNSYNQYSNSITLPLHTLLTNDDINYVIQHFLKIIEKYKKA
ncbi:DegT/DnrJ/EryC1/StrS aminotransferase family protein [Halobacillus sp. KGW1]|uniref:DegT/DnrJ/EryC1/StrS family aminotransferase n=1 Tax=Halobacillus sp. KGW1 TaxID=1793726 RepID=UPI0007829816|nr:DegT/DnrJ/EryC1/StrS aminotransferase family protein [Halobacillus sp. KGW1]